MADSDRARTGRRPRLHLDLSMAELEQLRSILDAARRGRIPTPDECRDASMLSNELFWTGGH